MLVILGLLITLALAAVAFISPFGGLLCYWAWFLVRPQEFLPGFGGTYPLERILALSVIAGMMLHYKILRNHKLFSHSLNRALLAFLAVNLLSALSAIWLTHTLMITFDFLKIVILYFLIVNLIDSESRLRKFLWVYLLCILWTAGSSLYHYFQDPLTAQGIERAEALVVTLGDPNALATTLALAIPIGLALQRYTRPFMQRQFLRIILVFSVACIVLTGSRAGMLAVIALSLLLAWTSPRRILALPVSLGFLLLVWVLMPATYQERFMTISTFTDTSTAAGASAYGRIIGWKVAFEIFQDHPLLGVGAGNFPTAWGTLYTWEGKHGWFQPHNMPGQLLSELGLLGAITFGCYIWILVKSNRETRLQLTTLAPDGSLLLFLNRTVVVVICTLFVSGFFGHNLYRYNWYLIGALTIVLGRLAQQAVTARAAVGKETQPEPDSPTSFQTAPMARPLHPGVKL